MKRLLMKGAAFIAALLAIVIAGGVLLDTKTRPAPDLTSGYTSFSLPVAHRNIPLPVTVWYPTDAKAMPTLLGQNGLFYGHYAQVDAPAVPKSFPVVLLSHGSGGNAIRLGWLASELAKQDFIVVAVDHPGTTSGDSDPFQTVKIWERPADMTAVLDNLAVSPPHGIVPDMSRVGVIGFSLGGQTALALSGVQYSKDDFIAYCAANAGLQDCGWMQAAGVDFTQIEKDSYEASLADPRIIATVAVDPAGGRAVIDLAALKTKAEIINLGEAGTIPEAMRADDLAQASGSTYLTIADSWHFSFLAECSPLGRIVMWVAGEDPICTDVNGRDRGNVQAELIQETLSFLKEALSPHEASSY